MAINLLGIQPHKVSRDLSGYITYIYGAPKTGKTTLATQMPKALLLAFERGYNALPGVFAQDINTWGEMKTVYRELKKPEVRAAYDTVIVILLILPQLFVRSISAVSWASTIWVMAAGLRIAGINIKKNLKMFSAD